LIGPTLLFWRIGRRIHHEVLGSERAAYGEQIVATLSRQLAMDYGRGYSEKNLRRMVQFAEAFSDEDSRDAVATIELVPLSALLPLIQAFQREFYAEMCRIEGWSVRTLREWIDSMLYKRTALWKQPDALIRQELAILRGKGDVTLALVPKDPYVLDFLGLTDRFLEHDLEDAILRELEIFLLELGAGFSFVARQKRIQLDGDDFYIDLLFYNRKLERPVVVELKQDNSKPEYKGQMELYLRWLAQDEREPEENLPLGIILCAGKKYRADRTAGTRCCRYPRGRVFDSSAPSRGIAGEAARSYRGRADTDSITRGREYPRATGKRALLIAAPFHPLPDRQSITAWQPPSESSDPGSAVAPCLRRACGE
jgi:predicted nuclease of restriction endonuclease-like (RecB) superfamily